MRKSGSLSNVDLVVVSHDHLDRQYIADIFSRQRSAKFAVSPEDAATLEGWGVPGDNILALDLQESVTTLLLKLNTFGAGGENPYPYRIFYFHSHHIPKLVQTYGFYGFLHHTISIFQIYKIAIRLFVNQNILILGNEDCETLVAELLRLSKDISLSESA